MRERGHRASPRRPRRAAPLCAAAVVTAVLLAGCVAQPPGIFDRPQTDADRPTAGALPAWPVVVDPGSIRLAGESAGAAVWVARTKAEPGNVCLMIDIPGSPQEGGTGCGGGSRVGVEIPRLEARLQLSGILDEDIPEGWKRLTREVIVSD